MNILTFTYTKAPDSVSERVLVVSAEPNKMYKGTDISELSHEEQAQYLIELNKVYEDYLINIRTLEEDFDLRHRYRQFDPAKMTNIVREDI